MIVYRKKIKDNGTQKAVQRQRMGILLCELNFREIWRRNENIRAELGQILHTRTRGSISSKDVDNICQWQNGIIQMDHITHHTGHVKF